MSSGAHRQRRYRRHKAGDHSLCLPDNCDLAGQVPVAPVVTSRVTRGVTLWSDMGGDLLPAASRVLLEEACRIADRLDRLDALLDGTAADWVSLVEDKGDPERLHVVIDRPLAEARQQATALKQLMQEIRAAGADVPARPAAGGKEAAGVTDLTTWAPARSAKAPG